MSCPEHLRRRQVLWLSGPPRRLLRRMAVYADRPTRTAGRVWYLWGSEGSPVPGRSWRTVRQCNLFGVKHFYYFIFLFATPCHCYKYNRLYVIIISLNNTHSRRNTSRAIASARRCPHGLLTDCCSTPTCPLNYARFLNQRPVLLRSRPYW